MSTLVGGAALMLPDGTVFFFRLYAFIIYSIFNLGLLLSIRFYNFFNLVCNVRVLYCIQLVCEI